MPTYVYQCQDCEADFEEKYPFNQIEEHPPCPICPGGFTVRRLSSFSIFTPGRASRPVEAPATSTSTFSHGSDCLCCYPRPTRVRKKSNKKKIKR